MMWYGAAEAMMEPAMVRNCTRIRSDYLVQNDDYFEAAEVLG